MPEVTFYVLAADDVAERFACRFALSCRRRGLDLCIYTAGQEQAEQLDRMLWTFRDVSFVPHRPADQPPLPAEPGPHVTVAHPDCLPPPEQRRALCNLSDGVPQCATEFERIAEIVGASPTQRTQARERFRAYQQLGCTPRHHDLSHQPA